VTCKTRYAAVGNNKVIGGVDAHAVDMGIPFRYQAVALPDDHGTSAAVRDQCHKVLNSDTAKNRRKRCTEGCCLTACKLIPITKTDKVKCCSLQLFVLKKVAKKPYYQVWCLHILYHEIHLPC